MSPFERPNPAPQHHIVNSPGWRALRPFREAAIPPILAGENLIVLAPTAGGKTEAAFFPSLSRALSDGWTGLSILYICPIKALLNNLDVRLQRYCSLLGRRSALWHGDIARRKYTERDRSLADFDPSSDIAIGSTGCWQWNSDKPTMHRAVREYFQSRREDD